MSLIPKIFYAILKSVIITSGDKLRGFKLLLSLFLLLIASCAEEGSTTRPTVDATQRWLNAKCPPSEVCAPENEAERVGRAYLAAILGGDCDEAASYWEQDMHGEVLENCRQGMLISGEVNSRCRLKEYEVEKGIVEDTTRGKSIDFSGYFIYFCEDAGREFQTDNLKLHLDQQDGNWEISGIEG